MLLLCIWQRLMYSSFNAPTTSSKNLLVVWDAHSFLPMPCLSKHHFDGHPNPFGILFGLLLNYFWVPFGILFGLLVDSFLRSFCTPFCFYFWIPFGLILNYVCAHFGFLLYSFWTPFGLLLCPLDSALVPTTLKRKCLRHTV